MLLIEKVSKKGEDRESILERKYGPKHKKTENKPFDNFNICERTNFVIAGGSKTDLAATAPPPYCICRRKYCKSGTKLLILLSLNKSSHYSY